MLIPPQTRLLGSSLLTANTQALKPGLISPVSCVSWLGHNRSEDFQNCTTEADTAVLCRRTFASAIEVYGAQKRRDISATKASAVDTGLHAKDRWITLILIFHVRVNILGTRTQCSSRTPTPPDAPARALYRTEAPKWPSLVPPVCQLAARPFPVSDPFRLVSLPL